jgi:hypothetical protein
VWMIMTRSLDENPNFFRTGLASTVYSSRLMDWMDTVYYIELPISSVSGIDRFCYSCW